MVSPLNLKSFEVNRFAQLKTPILIETKGNMAQIKDVIAGQGHNAAPGHLISGLFDIEFENKLKLSDANLTVVQEAYDMRTRHLEVQLSAEAKYAEIEFDQWQQQLFLDLEAELNFEKNAAQMHSVFIRDAEVENNLRRLIVDRALKNIKITLETAKQQALPYRNQILDLSDQLNSEKGVTLQKRLQVIPLVSQYLDRQSEIIAKDEQVVISLEAILPLRVSMANMDTQIAYKDLAIANAQLSIAHQFVSLYASQLATANLQIQAMNTKAGVVPHKQAAITAKQATISTLLTAANTEKAAAEQQVQVRSHIETALGHEASAITTEGNLITARTTALTAEAKINIEKAKFFNARDRYVTAQTNLITAKEFWVKALEDKATEHETVQSAANILLLAEEDLDVEKKKLHDDKLDLKEYYDDVITAIKDTRIAQNNLLAARRDYFAEYVGTEEEDGLHALMQDTMDVSTKENGILDKLGEKNIELGKIADKEETDLIPAINSRLEALQGLLTEMENNQKFAVRLINAKIDRALLAEDRATAEELIADARVDMITAQNTLKGTQLGIRIAEIIGQSDVSEERATQMELTEALESTDRPLQWTAESAARTNDLERMMQNDLNNAEIALENAGKVAAAKVELAKTRAKEQHKRREMEHNFQMQAQVTTNLTHLLGATS